MKVLVVSDTHVPSLARKLPDPLYEEMQGCSAILHAGDLVSARIMDDLSRALPFYGVQGNQDSPSVQSRLPTERVVVLDGWRIGLVHGHQGKGMYTEDRAFNAFKDVMVDIIVFGHSHQPLSTRREGILLFNPGSPVAGRGGEGNTYGLLELRKDKIDARIVSLP